MRILTIQDISCLGQCSMTVALPVLSACGHETCILPTAMLSTHTGGFQNPAVIQLADFIPRVREHWAREGIAFDAVYTGYLGSVAAIRETEQLVRDFLKPKGLLIVDPAMADHGKLYKGFDTRYAEAMAGLCRHADMILPNITEAAMLSGLPFRDRPDESYLTDLLSGLDHPCVVMTGAGCQAGETGAAILDHGKRYDYRHPKLGGNYHGTGDLFASAFTGALLRGKTMEGSARIGAEMVCEAIRHTRQDPDHWYGVKFEAAIPWLVSELTK